MLSETGTMIRLSYRECRESAFVMAVHSNFLTFSNNLPKVRHGDMGFLACSTSFIEVFIRSQMTNVKTYLKGWWWWLIGWLIDCFLTSYLLEYWFWLLCPILGIWRGIWVVNFFVHILGYNCNTKTPKLFLLQFLQGQTVDWLDYLFALVYISSNT